MYSKASQKQTKKEHSHPSNILKFSPALWSRAEYSALGGAMNSGLWRVKSPGRPNNHSNLNNCMLHKCCCSKAKQPREQLCWWRNLAQPLLAYTRGHGFCLSKTFQRETPNTIVFTSLVIEIGERWKTYRTSKLQWHKRSKGNTVLIYW